MSISPSELARLVVAFSVVPLLVSVSRRMRLQDAVRIPYTVLMSAIYLSYVLTIFEGIAAEELMNALQHLCLGVSGIAAILVAKLTRDDVLARRHR